MPLMADERTARGLASRSTNGLRELICASTSRYPELTLYGLFIAGVLADVFADVILDDMLRFFVKFAPAAYKLPNPPNFAGDPSSLAPEPDKR